MLALLLAGCQTPPAPPAWADQLAPGGPCHSFDLTDGLGAGDNT